MLRIFKQLLRPIERRKYVRSLINATVSFRIVDSNNPAIHSRVLQGKVFDVSQEGLCIGTNLVQIDGLHVFHPSSQHKNNLEIEVKLDPDLPSMKTFGEVKWYSKVEEEIGWIYRMGVTWLSLGDNDQQTLKNFLKTKTYHK
ncbi:MAG: hypothetical protein A2162_04120 [Deltaproteobacteria bacterium RBG_13_52_11b]|nr:MAG: hypothetical protein A2162_04120 [Deltaproteobacteria bacterium RBG_13_52_11b]